jgi:hypothetical protein
MNPFLLPAEDRLSHWKNFRTQLATMTEAEQLAAVATYWSLAPLSTIAYDPEALDECPTAWEMIKHNDWCSNSIAVGMEFTLRLSGWDASRLILRNVKDYDLCLQKIVLEIDNAHFINYDYSVVVPLPETRYDILDSWQFTGRHYSKI